MSNFKNMYTVRHREPMKTIKFVKTALYGNSFERSRVNRAPTVSANISPVFETHVERGTRRTRAVLAGHLRFT